VLKRLLTLLLLLGVLASTWVFWHVRDRNRGYQLDLDLRAPANAPPLPLRVGFGRMKMTPDLSRPVWLAGFANGRRATAVHDDLWAVAAVIDDGSHRVGIVALDAIGLFHDDVVAIRQLLTPGARLDYLIVASTHTHSAPDLMGIWGPRTGISGVDADYRRQVIDAAAGAVITAVGSMEPAYFAAREIPVPTEGLVADTRDPQVFDATVRMMLFLNPLTGRTIGSIVNWGNHPETPWSDNTAITADFPGYLREALARGVQVEGKTVARGLGGIHLFVNGAIGGLMTTDPGTTVVDPFDGRAYGPPSHEKARAVGHRLADAIFSSLEAEAPVPQPRPLLHIVARSLLLSLDNPLFRLASAVGTIDRGQPAWNTVRTELALLTLGTASIACLPGELYPEIANGGVVRAPGADFDVEPIEVPPLRTLMPGEVKFLFGLANDEIGYIIPKSEWDDREPWLYGAPARPYGEVNSLGADTAPRLHDAFKELAGSFAQP